MMMCMTSIWGKEISGDYGESLEEGMMKVELLDVELFVELIVV